MTATNEAWISDSLARLEQLESQREQLANTGRADALAELDEEIKSLYEVLESAAQDDGSAANNSPAAPHPAFGPTPFPMASQMTPPPMAQPIVEMAPASIQPEFFPTAPPMAAPMAAMTDSMGDDEPSGGKGALIGIVAVVLLAGAGGGWWFMNRAPEAPVVEAPSGPAKIIQAGAIPDDTQEPDVAKGGAASRTPGIVIKQPAAPNDDRRPSATRPASTPSAKPTKPGKPSRADAIEVGKSDDPLAGVR